MNKQQIYSRVTDPKRALNGAIDEKVCLGGTLHFRVHADGSRATGGGGHLSMVYRNVSNSWILPALLYETGIFPLYSHKPTT